MGIMWNKSTTPSESGRQHSGAGLIPYQQGQQLTRIESIVENIQKSVVSGVSPVCDYRLQRAVARLAAKAEILDAAIKAINGSK